MSFSDDRELLDRCLTGDRQAAADFVSRFSDLIYRAIQQVFTVRHIRYTSEDLEDMHNQVFLILFDHKGRKLAQFRGENGCSLATWLTVVTGRTVMNQLRKRGFDGMAARNFQMHIDDFAEVLVDRREAWVGLEKAEQWQLVQEGIDQLPGRDRLFMKLHFNNGLTVAEVAETIDISVQNGHTMKHRAIGRLKEYISAAADYGAP